MAASAAARALVGVRAAGASSAVSPDVEVPAALFAVGKGGPISDRDAGTRLALVILVVGAAVCPWWKLSSSATLL